MKTNRRDFIKSALATATTAILGTKQTPKVEISAEDEWDHLCDQLIALAGDTTVIINARFEGVGFDADNLAGSLIANCEFDGTVPRGESRVRGKRQWI